MKKNISFIEVIDMKEEFKKFVSSHKELINFVNKNEMTWQKFYDMYSLYGENNDVWKPYLNNTAKDNNEKLLSNIAVKDLVNAFKNVDVDTMQKNITTINKALTLIGSLLAKNDVKEEYTPRPLYKKFED